MVKKLGWSLLVGMWVVSTVLAGCSSESSGSEGITVWAMGEEGKTLPALAKEYEQEHPGVKIHVQAIPWDTAHDKLLTAVASKNGPDVIQMGTSWMPEFVEAKALADLTPYVDEYPALASGNFYEGSTETVEVDGKLYGVPWYIDTRVLYYRKDALEQVGYQNPPKTWEELSDAALKLSKRGEGKYGITLDPNEQTLTFMFARQNGSELIGENEQPLFDEPEFTEASQYLVSFFENGSAPVDFDMDIVQAFAGEEAIVPMFISGSWMVKLIQDQMPDADDHWGTAVLPAKRNNQSFLGGSNLTVFEYSDRKEEAVSFVAYMSKPETQLKWMEMTNSLPAAKEAWEDERLASDENLKTFGEQLQSAAPMPMITQWEKIAQTYLQSFEKMYRGTADVEQELKAFNKKAEDILQ